MFKFLIGLMLGVGIAIGVVYYLNINQAQINSKLLDNQKTRVFDSTNTVILEPSTKIKEAGVVKAGESVANYDFYQILPDKSNSLANTNSNNQDNKFYLQVAAFNQIDLANELKVKLTLQGYDGVDIVQVNGNDKVFYRVVLGPYDDENEVNQVKSELKDNGFDANIIKEK
jgi:cell division protein FtsN